MPLQSTARTRVGLLIAIILRESVSLLVRWCRTTCMGLLQAGVCTNPNIITDSSYGDVLAAVWVGVVGPLRVSRVSYFRATDLHVTTAVTVENIGSGGLTNVAYDQTLNAAQEYVRAPWCVCTGAVLRVFVLSSRGRECTCADWFDSHGFDGSSPTTTCCINRGGHPMVRLAPAVRVGCRVRAPSMTASSGLHLHLQVWTAATLTTPTAASWWLTVPCTRSWSSHSRRRTRTAV